MRKVLIFLAATLCALTVFSGCKKKIDYSGYISEKRYDIYLYKDDTVEVTVYLAEKETPFTADGIKSATCNICEIFVTIPDTAQEVAISVGGQSGEMNYRAVERDYYLSFSGGNFTGNECEVLLEVDGKSFDYTAQSVLYDGVISCEDALKCVIEKDGELFKQLTSNGAFAGEIFIRLLYDDGCFYYVGICNRERTVNAYLVDGENGKIIAVRQTHG